MTKTSKAGESTEPGPPDEPGGSGTDQRGSGGPGGGYSTNSRRTLCRPGTGAPGENGTELQARVTYPAALQHRDRLAGQV